MSTQMAMPRAASHDFKTPKASNQKPSTLLNNNDAKETRFNNQHICASDYKPYKLPEQYINEHLRGDRIPFNHR